jgi:hypothetical protein
MNKKTTPAAVTIAPLVPIGGVAYATSPDGQGRHPRVLREVRWGATRNRRVGRHLQDARCGAASVTLLAPAYFHRQRIVGSEGDLRGLHPFDDPGTAEMRRRHTALLAIASGVAYGTIPDRLLEGTRATRNQSSPRSDKEEIT